MAIVVMSAATAAITFKMNFDDANELQDTQLRQVAAALATQPVTASDPHFRPRDGEDAETHFVIRVLGSGDVDPDPWIDVALSTALQRRGCSRSKPADVQWRVMVARNASGQMFGVAQRQRVRDEVARDSAVTALVPMLVLVPLLLLIVNLMLRQGFAPLAALSPRSIAATSACWRRWPTDAHSLRGGAPRARRQPAAAAPGRRAGAAAPHGGRRGARVAHARRRRARAGRQPRTCRAAFDARARLESLQRGLARISELVEQLLQARPRAGSHPGRRPADRARCGDPHGHRADARRSPRCAEIDLGCVRLDRAQVRGDPAHAYALIRNAIDNAVRYTPQGGWVDVSLVVDDGCAVVAVEDTGVGIPADLRERVFEPFFRVLGSEQSGNGLGLAIVRSAAQALGGNVELTGRLDGKTGLRFVYRQKLA